MGRIGTTSSNFWYWAGVNSLNVVTDWFTMPRDGWVTDMGVHAGGYNATTYARFAMWDFETKDRFWMSSQQNWNSGRSWRDVRCGAIRKREGDRFYAGFVRHSDHPCQWSVLDNSYHHDLQTSSNDQVPDRLNPSVVRDNQLTEYVDFTPNQRPDTPRFDNATPSGFTGEMTPALGGNLPHPQEDRAYDYTTSIHVRIYDQTANRMVYDNEFTTTEAERNQGRWARRFGGHDPDHSYWAEYRHKDSWGVFSYMAPRTFYTCINGPDRPAPPVNPNTPANQKINALTGIRYHAQYSHPNGLAPNAAQVEVWNADRTVRIYDSGWRSIVGPNTDKTFGLDQWHPALEWGRGYSYRVRVRDSSLIASGYSNFFSFRTNTAPFIPTNLSPGGGKTSGSRVLRCSVGDADGDDISVQAWLYTSTGALVAGYPKPMVLSDDGTTATLDVGTATVFGSRYRWEAQATDGVLFSSKSPVTEYVFAQIPDVVITSPTQFGVTNWNRQPSAEYDTVAAYWTLSAGVSVSKDGDASEGIASWKSVGASGVACSMTTPFMSVNTQKPFKLFSKLKRVFGDGKASLQLLCYNNSNTLLGTLNVFPLSEINDYWTTYGGFVSPSQYPVGTTKVSVRIQTLNAQTMQSENRADSVVFGEVEKGTEGDPSYWWGYFDGDSVGYGPPGSPSYAWSDVRGDSPSNGLNVLSSVSGVEVHTTYFSPSGQAKADDRIEVQKWNGAAWVTRHSTNFLQGNVAAGNRTSVPIPAAALDNESRYRLKLWVKDSLGVIAETEYVEFDVKLQGPPELRVVLANGDPLRAEIVVAFDPTILSDIEFGGIEVEVEQRLGEKVTYFFTDPKMNRFVYPFPESGFAHNIRLRQIRLVSDEKISGRWTETSVSCDYAPLFFLKDTEEPERLMVGFEVVADTAPGFTKKRNVKSYQTWHTRRPKYAVGPARYDEGSITATLFSDISKGDEPERDLALLEEMSENMDTLCYLAHRPSRKRFIQIMEGGEFGTDNVQDYTVTFPYSEATYYEDHKRRDEEIE